METPVQGRGVRDAYPTAARSHVPGTGYSLTEPKVRLVYMNHPGPHERLETWPDAAAALDAETGTLSAVNERWLTVCGGSRERFRGAQLTALTPEGWHPRAPLGTLLERARDGRVTFELRIERPDGTTVDLRCAMRVGGSDDGALVTVHERDDPALGTAPADVAPARSDRELRELIDGMNDPIFVVDRDGNYVDANRAAIERLGYTRAELLSMGPADVAPPEHAARVDERMRKLTEDETLVFESAQVTAGGEEIPVEINASRITYRGEPAFLSVARDISDRKRRRRRLRTLEQAVEHAGHAVYITDTDGTIEYVNPAFERITGYDAARAVGKTPAILNSGEYGEDYYADLWTTILDGEVWRERIENERADGERYHAEQTIAPIVEDGEVVKFVAVQQDITQRRERERELERYQQLIENVPVGVYRNTPGLAGEFEEVNPAMVEMFDAGSARELLDTHVAELYRNPGQRAEFSRTLESEERVVNEELRLETTDGEPFWGAVTAIRHEIDGRVYYDGIIQDVTERREKARELRFRERRFRRLFEGHSAPMLLVDPDSGAIERANDAAAEFYGYDAATLESMTIQAINQLDDEEVARRRRVADQGERNRFIFPHELADGEVRQVEVDSSPINTGDDRLLFSIVHDVTERERNRRTLERQNEQLELLNRVVRHDIRNDMSVIINYAELLRDHVDDAGAEHLDTLAEHSEHVVELTRTVRELMETMLGEDASEHGSVDLARVLRSEIEDLDAGHDDVSVTVDTPLPDVSVRGNEMLSSVFRNVLANAVTHNDKDEPAITVRAETTADAARVHIADNGPGIPASQREEIFGKGEHGIDSPGTGLGLYLVHTFVDQFGGEVWVTDNEPTGAVFHVELPRSG